MRGEGAHRDLRISVAEEQDQGPHSGRPRLSLVSWSETPQQEGVRKKGVSSAWKYS